MAIAHVQTSAEVTVTAGTVGTPTLSVTSGNFLVALIDCTNSTSTFTISDGTNTWTKDQEYAGSGLAGSVRVVIASCQNAVSGTINVTCTASGSSNFVCRLVEFSGVATSSVVDVSGVDDDTNTTIPRAWTAGGTIAAGSVVVCGFVFDRTTTATAGSGYTGITSAGTLAFNQFQVFASGGSTERGLISIVAGAHYAGALVAYKAAAGGSSSLPIIHHYNARLRA